METRRLEVSQIEAVIDCGFIERIDCCGNTYYWHEAGIVINNSDPTWLLLRKMEVASTYNALAL